MNSLFLSAENTNIITNISPCFHQSSVEQETKKNGELYFAHISILAQKMNYGGGGGGYGLGIAGWIPLVWGSWLPYRKHHKENLLAGE
jgi:hypothetical protein